jgi:hypothetical protein
MFSKGQRLNFILQKLMEVEMISWITYMIMEFCFDIVGFKQYIFGFNLGRITLNKRLILWLNLLLDDD